MDQPSFEEIHWNPTSQRYHKMLRHHLVFPTFSLRFSPFSEVVACFISDGRQATESATVNASVGENSAPRNGSEQIACAAEVTYLQPNATCCKLMHFFGAQMNTNDGFFHGFLKDVCHFLLVSIGILAAKNCGTLMSGNRCRTSSRWKPATPTLARG